MYTLCICVHILMYVCVCMDMVCVERLIFVRCITHLFVWHDSFVGVLRLAHVCDRYMHRHDICHVTLMLHAQYMYIYIYI